MGLDNEFGAGRPWIAFDIETCPLVSCAEYLTDPIEAPGNYKDPEKIKAFITEKRLKQIADAALDLDLCEIVAIAANAGTDGTLCLTRQECDERKMLETFWRFAREKTLVGFNCLSFDLPILLRRSLYLHVLTPHVNIDRYRHEGVIDVADVLTYNGRMTWRSLAFYCKRFSIPYDHSIDGAQVPALVEQSRWAEIATHAAADVAATAALAQRIGLVYSPVELAL